MKIQRQPRPVSESVDNYLKAILSLGGPAECRVNSTAISEYLRVAPSSVTNMLQKLSAEKPPLVRYERHRGVLLSVAGKRRALEVLRHHRLIETFLYKMLDYPIEELHEEAERLEHFISERFEERIAAKLGNPSLDPHGHSIPAMDGSLPREGSIPLTEALLPGTLIVDSISDRDAATLKRLKTFGIAPGVRLIIQSRNAKQGYAVRIGRAQKSLYLAQKIAEAIRVRATA